MSNMAVQMNYGEPSRGMPGGLYDRAEYEAVTRRNSAEDKALCFGYGVVQGAEPGKDILNVTVQYITTMRNGSRAVGRPSLVTSLHLMLLAKTSVTFVRMLGVR